MRDGKSSEAISFVHSGAGAHSSYQAHQDTPAVSEPPMPAAPAEPDDITPESPVSSVEAGLVRELRRTAAECIRSSSKRRNQRSCRD